mgnify:CR=1 FL=1
MKKIVSLLFIGMMIVGGCGYSTRTVSPTMDGIKTIYIAPFQNKVDYGTEGGNKNLYVPMMEVKVTSGTINRFITDGFLKVAKPEEADIILKGELINYRRDVLRYDDYDVAREYRITIIVAMTLLNAHTNEVVWTEPSFGGESTYLVDGPSAKSESVAIDEAVKDLAQRIIERTVEDW